MKLPNGVNPAHDAEDAPGVAPHALFGLMSDGPPPLNVPCLVHLGDRKHSVWMVGEHRKIGSNVAFRADFTGGMGWPVPTERAKREYGNFHLWVILPNVEVAREAGEKQP